MSDPQLDSIRRDVARLGMDLSKGMSGTTVLLEQAEKKSDELSRRLDEKVREDHQSDLARTAQLAALQTKVDALQRGFEDLPERVAKLELNAEHIREDITGKHDLAKVAMESTAKAGDRALEQAKLSGEERKARLQFWGSIAVVAIPGLISLLWQLFDLPGDPPRATSTPPAAHAPERHEP